MPPSEVPEEPATTAVPPEDNLHFTQLEKTFLREHLLLERIFDTVPLMMTIYEPDTKILRVNRAFERLVGWSTAELAGISLMDECYPDPEYREMAREFMQACRPEWRDFRVRTRDGSVVESSWTNVRLPDGTQLGIGLDITERNRADAALRESDEALRRADHLKDEFLATLAHELRNPLSPMRNAMEILRDEGTSGESADRALSVLDRQLELMVRLVDDLMDISRITTGKIELHPVRVDIDTVVQKAFESGQPPFEGKHQVIYEPRTGAPLYVDGDPIRLEQVFANLLHNAAKFTPPRGMVCLDVGEEGGQAVVRVRDTGIGIAPDLLPHIFDMFVQADRSVDRTGGLGIGLSLVKRLVELHGGSVEASSAGLGQGSEFVVRLPLSARIQAEAAPSAAPRDGTSADRRRAVLVVDDNVDSAETLATLLSAWGHDVLVAHDGRSAIEVARTRGRDVIVMDLAMPRMSGYSAARLIRRDPRLAGIVLIALTGWGQPEARRESAEAGFDHHLVKPVDTAALREILRREVP